MLLENIPLQLLLLLRPQGCLYCLCCWLLRRLGKCETSGDPHTEYKNPSLCAVPPATSNIQAVYLYTCCTITQQHTSISTTTTKTYAKHLSCFMQELFRAAAPRYCKTSAKGCFCRICGSSSCGAPVAAAAGAPAAPRLPMQRCLLQPGLLLQRHPPLQESATVELIYGGLR